MRLFLDANILFLAGYSTASPVHDLLSLARKGRCELLTSGYAMEEARRNLLAKGPEDALERINRATACVVVTPEAAPAARELATAAALTDPSDVPILAAAIQCSADILVTGDRRAFGRYFRKTIAGTEVLLLRDALRKVLGLPRAD